ncbi:ABC transporter permease [Haloterrigena salifodinae]|uniref:ABC transporter permease n=1 Tax=Haloterrigena salifodinae TaxID=2675099 RepID=A0A8T8E219_9EURY|nr:ABC transporter permease [Haloterrigena salifodinae]QRV15809.1 ABC transporter permease [Haloterrigena salifodinae]
MVDEESAERTRVGRWLALVRFAAGRIATQARRTPRRTAVTVGLVAITIALLVTVTGISVALAGDTTADDNEADLRVVPHEGGTFSPVVGVEGPRLSDVHDRTETIDNRADVDYATPVLMEVVQARSPEGEESVNVMAVGVVPRESSPPVGGVPTAPLEPGDPHYANGSYDGPRTGDVVLSTAASDQLNASEEASLVVRGSQMTANASAGTYEVTAVEDADTASLSDGLPVVVLRLSELQTLTGADDEDLADQVLVGTDSDGAHEAIEETYPNATVESGTEPGLAALQDDDLALATSLITLIVGIGICTLFVTTATGLLVERERQTLAVLSAVGFPGRSRLAVVAVMTLTLTVVGAVVGIALGYAGVAVTNWIATSTVTSSPIATTDPLFVPYALAIAVVAGLFALPYPLYLTTKTDVVAELRQ